MIGRTGTFTTIYRCTNFRAISTPKRSRNRVLIRTSQPSSSRYSRRASRHIPVGQIRTKRNVMYIRCIARVRSYNGLPFTFNANRYTGTRITKILTGVHFQVNITTRGMVNSITRNVHHKLILANNLVTIPNINCNVQVEAFTLVSNAGPYHSDLSTTFHTNHKIRTRYNRHLNVIKGVIRPFLTTLLHGHVSRNSRANNRKTKTEANRPILRRPTRQTHP